VAVAVAVGVLVGGLGPSVVPAYQSSM
jgi:hypothetical protein